MSYADDIVRETEAMIERDKRILADLFAKRDRAIAAADAARVRAREPEGGNPSDEGGRLEPDGDGEERTGTPKDHTIP